MLNQGLSTANIPTWMNELLHSGMRSPAVRHISPGTKIFRFASSDTPHESWPAGPWWFGREAFNQIKTDALQANAGTGFGIGWSARRAMAVRQGWSRMDILIEARVKTSIFIFYGKGTKQYRELAPNGMYITWEGWPNVDQWFLPYISDRVGNQNVLSALGKQAIEVYRTGPVESYQMFEPI